MTTSEKMANYASKSIMDNSSSKLRTNKSPQTKELILNDIILPLFF